MTASIATSEKVSLDRAKWCPLAASVLLIIACLPMLWPNEERGFAWVFTDDTYYYLKPAIGFWKYGFLTFDGQSATNGFHPLWSWCLTALAYPFVQLNIESAIAPTVTMLSLAMFVATQQIWIAAVKRCGVEIGAASLASLAACLVFTEFAFFAMETLLQVALLGVVALQVLAFESRFARVFSLAVWMVLLFFARLDSFVIVAFVCVFLWWRHRFRDAVSTGALTLVGVLPYLYYNYASFGSLQPVSGKVKSFWASLRIKSLLGGDGAAEYLSTTWLFKSMSGAVRSLVHELAPLADLLTLNGIHRVFSLYALMVVAVGLLLVALLGAAFALFTFIRARPKSKAQVQSILYLAPVLIPATLLQIYAFKGSMIWLWYLALGLFLQTLCLVAIAAASLARICTFSNKASFAIALLWTASGFGRNLDRRLDPRESGYYVNSAETDAWFKEHAGSGRVGSWAAGATGWSLSTPVVNLEGLATDFKLLESTRVNTQLYQEFLDRDIRLITNHFPLRHYGDIKTWLLNPKRSDAKVATFDVRWILRFRNFFDHPDAFKFLREEKLATTTQYTLSVDHELLRDYIVTRERWRRELRKEASIIPAEFFNSALDPQQKFHVRRTEGHALSARSASYNFETDKKSDVFLRLHYEGAEAGSLDVTLDGREKRVQALSQPGWQRVWVGTTAEGQSTLKFSKVGNVQVLVDEIYVTANREAFEKLLVDSVIDL